ncbi:MAG: non-canonical purine NTP pyrophosphatase [Planctomycetota bacterium]
MQPLLLCSRNPGKLAELRALLEDLPVEVLAPDEVPFPLPDVAEDGRSFFDNALKKAFAAAETASAAGRPEIWALADDSGLVVDALNGEPGVRSARYAGEEGSRAERDQRNLALLLGRLDGVPAGRRTARFACVIAVARGDELLFAVEGAVEGRILEAPEGRSGFGYDPVFYHEASGRSFACLDPEEKNAVSHRGQAMARLRAVLDTVLAGQKPR